MLIILPFDVSACWNALNEEITIKHETLIDQTKIIVLGKLYKKEQQGSVKQLVKYYFNTVEVLKGKAGKTFDTVMYGMSEYTENTSYNNHTDEIFWKNRMGRAGYADEGCNKPIPGFDIGETYLIFFESKDSKSFELINDKEKDKWYLFVKNYIEKKQIR